MSAFARSKGKRGELEVAALMRDLLGIDARRRVRQHESDSDVIGPHGWSVEVKNCATLDIPGWWRQTVAQANNAALPVLPVLFYKVPRKGWRCRWPLAVLLGLQEAEMWTDLEWTADTSPDAWAAVVRELMPEASR